MNVDPKRNLPDQPERCTDFSQLLLAWDNALPGRGLPWAHESDPYRVWVSEIMLQQTQAKTVIPYFERFIERFPAIIDLADAPLDEVLRLWTGLGYYSRARNLHKAARQVVDQYAGIFPRSFAEVFALPGVGRSTAGAICALAFGVPTPILDGNAKRVYARYFGIDDEKESARMRRLWRVAEACTAKTKCQKYTQLIMDLGATVCTPRNPACNNCPVSSGCYASEHGATHMLPRKGQRLQRKTKSTAMVMVRNRNGEVLLERRPAAGIWGGLWSFPEFDGALENLADEFGQRYQLEITLDEEWEELSHEFTHFRLKIKPLLARVAEKTSGNLTRPDIAFISIDSPFDRGMPAPVAELIDRLQAIPINPEH